MPKGSVEHHFKVNTEAAVLLIKKFTEQYENHNLSSGRVINIRTHNAQYFPNQISYGSSKAALEAYTRSLSVEPGSDNIAVNCIAPGHILSLSGSLTF